MRFIGWLLCACLVTASSGCDFGGGGDQLQVEVDSDQLSDQAEGHLLEFTSRFGSRPAASEQERAAAEYLRAALEESGYQTELQAFTVQLLPRQAESLSVDGVGPFVTSPIVGTRGGTISGQLVDLGEGAPSEIPASGIDGRIAVIRRSDAPLGEVVRAVIDAGAIASVIINDEPGMLNGSFGGRMDAIAVGVSGEDGLRLLNAIQSGSASASLNLVETDQPSQNVVATLAGSSGRTIVLGAHYDSVVDSPGVNDNASGVAIVLTLAEWFAQHERRDTIQVILFGAEEVELQGSRHFVASLSAGQLGSIEFMVNFDAVATGALQTGGSPDLVSDAIHVADVAGFPLAAEGVPPGAASDHTPFELAGTPALVIFGSDYSKIHSTDDTQQWINPALLGQASAIGIQMALVD